MKRNRKVISERKRRRKTQAYKDGGGKSPYARKAKYLAKHALFGFQVREPKPWRSAA